MRMRVVASIALLMSLLVSPGSALGQAALGEGDQLMRRREFAAARAFYSGIAEPRARVLEARAALADGDTDGAESVLQNFFAAYPGSDQTPAALMTLAQVRRSMGDCSGALRALDAFAAEPGRPDLGPYVSLARAQCLGRLDDWSAELANARAGLAIENGGPRLTRIELLERAAEGATRLGRKQDAFDYYDQALSLASTRAYRAEMLFTTASIARALGRPEVDRFRAVVVDYPETARAAGALDALIDLGMGGSVSLLQAGTVRFYGKEYESAVSLLSQVPAGSPDAGPAGVLQAQSLVKLNRDDDARSLLSGRADSDPAAAGASLLLLGQLQLRAGEFGAAAGTFSRMAQVAPDRAAEASFYLGLARYVSDDRAGAVEAWDRGLVAQPTPAVEAQLQLWRGKVLPSLSAASSDALTRAATVAPESYAGLRAQELLGSSTMAAATLVDEPAEEAAWLAAYGTSAAAVVTDLAAQPGLRRAQLLLDLGQVTEAGYEIDGLMQGYVASKDAPHLGALADWLMQHDLPQLALRVGRAERDLAGLSALPRFEQKHAYPAAWADLVFDSASRFSVDPLLVLALMRQESSFDPRAKSPADARGLTQVVPSTARAIASKLGHDDFSAADLYKPAVSLDYGSWYLASVLREWHGDALTALAAYNAGSGNVSRWQNRFGSDPDVLVELIPFVETQTYLRIVYDNYRHYHMLYGAGSR